MSVVHSYYFLQLKIIWAIKLEPKFIFPPKISIFSHQMPGCFSQIQQGMGHFPREKAVHLEGFKEISERTPNAAAPGLLGIVLRYLRRVYTF